MNYYRGSKSFEVKIYSVRFEISWHFPPFRIGEGRGGEGKEIGIILSLSLLRPSCVDTRATRKRVQVRMNLNRERAKSVGINEWNQISPRLLIRYRSLAEVDRVHGREVAGWEQEGSVVDSNRYDAHGRIPTALLRRVLLRLPISSIYQYAATRVSVREISGKSAGCL